MDVSEAPSRGRPGRAGSWGTAPGGPLVVLPRAARAPHAHRRRRPHPPVATATDLDVPSRVGDRPTGRVGGVTASGGSFPSSPQVASPDPLVADEPGLNHAFVAYRPELMSMARRALGSPQLAEEAVQETYVRAWRSRDRFDPSLGSLRTWLFSIERNLLIDMARTRRRMEVRRRLPVPVGQSNSARIP